MDSPLDLESAIHEGDVELARDLFVALTGFVVVDAALDEEEPVLYLALQNERGVQGACAYVNENQDLVVVNESDGPFFVGAPASIIDQLDPTFGEQAVRWRRDCLARHYRGMAESAHLGHPAWTAFYSRQSLGVIKAQAHFGVVVGGAPQGVQALAITDGTGTRTVHVPVDQLSGLLPLWPLEWSSNNFSVMAMKGRGALRYVGLGPPEFRVGMLFNDLGGLLSWSGAASHCQIMADMANSVEEGFSRPLLLAQLNAWQGRSALV